MFLRSGRSTVIIFMHILISTIGAFLVMALMGRSLNVPALGGLAFAVGMLVDNAIVMLENIYRRHQLGESPEVASVKGASEVWGALLNATLANLAVFIPVLFIREEAGQLFRDIAIAISAAVALSMLVAVAVVPTAAMRILKRQDAPRRSPRAERLVRPSPRGWRGLLDAVWYPIDRLLAVCDRVAPVAGRAAARRQPRLAARRHAAADARAGRRRRLVRGDLALLAQGRIPAQRQSEPGDRHPAAAAGLQPRPARWRWATIVEDEPAPYWDIDPNDPEVKQQERSRPIEDFFFVARNRQVFRRRPLGRSHAGRRAGAGHPAPRESTSCRARSSSPSRPACSSRA